MKKQFIRSLSLLLCAVLLCSSASFGASAASFPAVTADEWNSYWQGYTDDGDAVILSPGSDDTQMNVSWYSPDCDGDSTVKLSLSSDMASPTAFTGTYLETPQGDRANKVTLTGLQSGTEYYYTCETAAEKTDVNSFTTSSGDGFSAIYVTDIHVSKEENNEYSIRDDSYKLDSVFRAALGHDSDISLVLSGGDQASYGIRSEYEGLAASPVLKSVPFAITCGNHDMKNIDYSFFRNVPNEHERALTASTNGADYWFVRDNALFLMMNSNNANISDHRNFIRDAIAANPDAKWRVAVFHHDLFGGRIEKREPENKLLRTIWVPVLDEFSIDLTLMGHSHYYTISNVIYGGESVEQLKDKDSTENPAGTIYMVSGSVNNPRYNEDEPVPPLGENVAKEIYTPDTIYNVLRFTDNSIKIDSYTLQGQDSFVSFTLNKTTQQGGHPEYKEVWYTPFVRIISFIAGFFNTLGREFDYFWELKVLPWWNGLTK